MTRPLVIYHANCADGFGAAFAAWLKLGDDAEYLPMQYGNIPEVQDLRDLVDSREVYVLDFSLPKQGMDELFRSAARVIWLDHHKSAFEMWIGGLFDGSEGCHHQEDQVRYITLDFDRSGALLAWDYFHPGVEAPLLIQHIDDYDRWQFKMGNTKAINKALWSYTPWSFEQWNVWNNGWGLMHGADMWLEGTAILRAHNQQVQSTVENATRKCAITGGEIYATAENTQSVAKGYEMGGYVKGYQFHNILGLAANCPPHLASDVGHELATQSGTFGLCWFQDSEGVVRCSLRSNGEYDVSAIAKVFGGGGHRNAAGFSTSMATLQGWLE